MRKEEEIKYIIKALLVLVVSSTLLTVIFAIGVCQRDAQIRNQQRTIDSLHFVNECLNSAIHPELHND